MSDVLGHDPARWPRSQRALVIATVVVVVGAATWLAVGNRKPHSAATPFVPPPSAAVSSSGVPPASASASAQVSSSVPPHETTNTFVATSPPPAVSPPALVGRPATNTGVQVLVASSAAPASVGIFALDGGTVSAVRGIAAGGCPVSNVFRIPGTEQWALVSQPSSDPQPCNLAAGGLYIVDGPASTAHLIGTAQRVVSADANSLWTVTGVDLLPGEQFVVPERVQRISLTGSVLSRVYVLPAGWTVLKGLTPDLLLLARDASAGSDNYETWQLSTGTAIGQYDRVVAANATVVVWVTASCAPNNCPVHLSAPATGVDRTVSLPANAYVYDGSLSDDGTQLALALGTGVDSQGATDQDSGVLVDVTSRVVHAIPQTTIPASETGSLELNWAARGWLIISTPGLNGTSQIAAYNPATGVFVLPQHGLPADVYGVV